MEIHLDQLENEQLLKISNLLNIDSVTRQLSASYLLKYKKETNKKSSENLLLINCAIFIASKSQILKTINGDTVRGIGISLSQLIKASPIENSKNEETSNEFLACLKDFISKVYLDPIVLTEINSIIEKYTVSSIYYNKYDNIFKALDITHKFGIQDYMTTLKNLNWLIFISAQKYFLSNNKNFIKTIYLLNSTLFQFLNLIKDFMTIKYIEKQPDDILSTNETNEDDIQQALLELFKLSLKKEEIQIHNKALNEFLSMLVEQKILSVNDTDRSSLNGLYDIKHIFTNLTKLEQYYLMRLNHDELDERFYNQVFKNGNMELFSPFIRQTGLYKNIMGQKQTSSKSQNPLQPINNYNSHKVLSYEELDESSNFFIKSRQNNLFNKPDKASDTIDTSIHSQQLPQFLELHKWLVQITQIEVNSNGVPSYMEEYCKVLGENFIKDKLIASAEVLVKKILAIANNEDDIESSLASNKKHQEQKDQIIRFYYKVLEGLLNQKQKVNAGEIDILSNGEYIKSMIACCSDIVLFIHENGTVKIAFDEVMKICQIDCLYYWNIVSKLSSLDFKTPFAIRKHLYDLEIKILFSFAWKKNSIMEKLIAQEETRMLNSISDDITPVFGSTYCTKNETSRLKIKPINEIKQILVNQVDKDKNTKETIEKQQKPTKLGSSAIEESFLEKMVNQAAFEIYQICELLKLPEKISEHVWSLMKYILTYKTHLAIQRNLIQLILCSIYSVCKVFHYPYKFQEILIKYSELPNIDEAKEITSNVYINDNDDEQQGDLIRFYNSVYVIQLRQFVMSLVNIRTNDNDSCNGNANHTTIPNLKLPEKALIPTIALYLRNSLRDSLPHPIQTKTIQTKKKYPMITLQSITNNKISPESLGFIYNDAYSKTPLPYALDQQSTSSNQNKENCSILSNTKDLKQKTTNMSQIFESAEFESNKADSLKGVKSGSIKQRLLFDETEEEITGGDSAKFLSAKKIDFISDQSTNPSSSIVSSCCSFPSTDTTPYTYCQFNGSTKIEPKAFFQNNFMETIQTHKHQKHLNFTEFIHSDDENQGKTGIDSAKQIKITKNINNDSKILLSSSSFSQGKLLFKSQEIFSTPDSQKESS